MPSGEDCHQLKHKAAVTRFEDDRTVVEPEHATPHHETNDPVREHHKNNVEVAQLTFYPAYCYRLSSTWFKWVKLTAWQIHHLLRSHSGYQATLNHGSTAWYRDPSLLLFYLNHPIQFVQVVGVVVSFEDFFEKFWSFTIDDSSGATIDVTCKKPESDPVTRAQSATLTSHQQLPARKDAKMLDVDLARLQTLLSENQISTGTVVTAKGTLTTFRSVRQISLLRLAVVPSTAAETSLLSSRTTFFSNVLSKPWTVDDASREKMRKEALGEAEKDERAKKRQRLYVDHTLAREQKQAQQIRKDYEQEETERQDAAQKVRLAGEALRRRRSERSDSISTTKSSTFTNTGTAVMDERVKFLREAFGK